MTIRDLPAIAPADLGVTTAEWTHLRREYAGVFDEPMMRRHISDHLGSDVAIGQVAMVGRRAPTARRVLDVACGWGAFAEAARTRWSVIGVDLATVELVHARDRGVLVARGDGCRLPIGSKSVDVVTMWNVLEHVVDRTALFREARRVLRPAGSLFIEAPNYASFRREAHYHVPWVPGLRGRTAVRWLRLLGRDPRFFEHAIHPCTWRAVRRELARAGFESRPLRDEKLIDPSSIRRPLVRALVETARRAGLEPLLRSALRAEARNPLQSSIRVQAVRR